MKLRRGKRERSNQVYDTMELFCVYIHPEIDTLNQEVEHFLGLVKHPRSAVAKKGSRLRLVKIVRIVTLILGFEDGKSIRKKRSFSHYIPSSFPSN